MDENYVFFSNTLSILLVFLVWLVGLFFTFSSQWKLFYYLIIIIS